jgi:sialic acid synthase SpsE
MASMDEIAEAVGALERGGVSRDQLTVLHCTTEYPAPLDSVNLLAMQTIRDRLGVEVGYSDHTEGITVSVAAAALGASVIEKHFTLDRNMPGPDHRASLEPDELSALVRGIRDVERALGTGEKRLSAVEERNKVVARKSLVALRPIVPGEIFGEDNVGARRPGGGISPMRWDAIAGRRAQRAYEADEPLDAAEVDASMAGQRT